MQLNIVDYYQGIRESQKAAIAAANQERDRRRAAALQLGNESKELETKIAAKRAFIQTAKQEGLDTSRMDIDIDAMEKQRLELESSQAARLQQAEELIDMPDQAAIDEAETMLRAATALRELECITAEPVDSIDGCGDMVCLGTSVAIKGVHPETCECDFTVDSSGKLLACRVWFDKKTFASIQIKGEQSYFIREFMPVSLRWHPDFVQSAVGGFYVQAINERDEGPSAVEALPAGRVYVDKYSQKLLLSFDPKERLRWSGDVLEDPWKTYELEVRLGNPSQAMYQLARNQAFQAVLAKTSVSCPTVFANEVHDSGGSIDLGTDYAGRPFLRSVQSQILALCSTENRILATERELVSDEVFAIIKDDWLSFVRSPWSERVTGVWAKLKHQLENGERPRFWCKDLMSHVGFRIRTRDHSWIVGAMFVDRAENFEPATGSLEVYKSGDNWSVAGLGRMCIRASRVLKNAADERFEALAERLRL